MHLVFIYNPKKLCDAICTTLNRAFLRAVRICFQVRYSFISLQIVEEHESVEQSRRAQAEPINLDSCLRAFTSEEELGEDEMYYCSKCKTHCLATKKLDLWRLPPILV